MHFILNVALEIRMFPDYRWIRVPELSVDRVDDSFDTELHIEQVMNYPKMQTQSEVGGTSNPNVGKS